MPIPEVVVSLLLDQIVSPLVDRLVSWGVSEIENYVNDGRTLLLRLKNGLVRVQHRLNDVVNSQPHAHILWEQWVGQLTDLCYKVDDILDEVALVEMKRRYRSNNPSSSWNPMKWWRWHRGSRTDRRRPIVVDDDEVTGGDLSRRARKVILSRFRNTPAKIEAMLSELTDIEEEVNRQLLQHPSSHSQEKVDVIPSVLLLPKGRQTDKNIIIKELIMQGKSVAIIGMAGLGKTAVARFVVDDHYVRQLFHVIHWRFNTNGQVTMHANEPFEGESLRTLTVLDGLENWLPTDFREREAFMASLNDQTLLITTRDPKVPANLNTVITPYYLRRMSDEDCAELIRSKVREVLSEEDARSFDRNALHIATKCMGLPLMAAIIGLTLRSCCHDAEMLPRDAIIESVRIDFWNRYGQQILGALRLDDPRLPSHLNKLLAYFTLFPHDQQLGKDGIVQLWLAEGFIQPEKWTNLWLEAHHFDRMLPKSMLDPIISNPLLKPSAYRTFEVTHWFAKYITYNRCLRVEAGENLPPPPFLARHLSLGCEDIPEDQFVTITNQFRWLRTLLLFQRNRPHINTVGHQIPPCLFVRLMWLRVLDLKRSSIDALPESIGRLKHLRYLDLSATLILMLPNSICELFGLRILKLEDCTRLRHLPDRIGDLVNLVYLELSGTPSSPPRRIGNVTKLLNLDTFKVKPEEGFSIRELRYMNQLQGSLCIMELENVENGNEAAEAELDQKPRLRNLVLQWTESSLPHPAIAEDVFSRLRPHTDLQELKVINYSGLGFPGWLSDRYLRNIHTICLHNFPHCSQLPPLGELPSLEALRIGWFPSLEHISPEFMGVVNNNRRRFESLRYLEFNMMTNLRSWYGNFVAGDMPMLKDLKFVRCPELNSLPALVPLESLASLEIVECQQLRQNLPAVRNDTRIN